MTRDEFAVSVSRFAVVALLLIFVTKLALADGQDIHLRFHSNKTPIDFPYQTERP